MQLTLDDLQIIAAIFSIVSSLFLCKWLMGLNIRYLISRSNKKISKSHIWSGALGAVLVNVLVFFMITSKIAISIIVLGEVLSFLILIKLAYSNVELLDSIPQVNDFNQVQRIKECRIICISQAMLALFGGVMLYLAFFPLVLWSFPDVATISKKGNTYISKLRYELPFAHGMKPGGSYLDNNTPDTLLRVIVRYSFPDKNIGNVYGITAKYPPHSFIKMIDKSDFIMRPIPLYLPPSRSKSGLYPTKKVFVVEKEQLWDFKIANMYKLGMKNNREVCGDSISEPSNKVVMNTKLKDYPATLKNSLHTYHYDGC